MAENGGANGVSDAIDQTYVLTGEVSVNTKVYETKRNIAAVSIQAGSLTVWEATLTQPAPDGQVAQELVLGNARIEAGMSIRMTIPTANQRGQLVLRATIDVNGVKQPFAAQVANWPLTG